MAFESKLLAVPSQTFTANGTSDGQITIADPYLFKIGQIVVIGSPNIELQIKRIAGGVIHVGPFDDNPETRTDVSSYTIGSYIFANEQLRPWIPRDGVIPNFPKLDYTYEEAPTVAQRNMLVDKSGAPVDIIEVSGVRRLAVETSVSVSTTSSGVQDVNVVNTPNIGSVDSITNIVRISGVVDFQRPLHVIVDDAPESVATISGIITVSGIAEQPVRIDHVVRVSGIVDIQRPLDVNVISSTPVNIPEPLDVNVTNSLPQHNVTVSGIVNISGIVDFQRPVHVIVDSAPESVTTISGVVTVSGVAEQPVRIDQVVRVSGVVDIQRPLDVNVLNSPPVNIPEPLDVTVVNSLSQHNVTVSGISGVVQVSGVVDFQRPLHVIVDSAPSSVTTISGVVTVSGVAEQPVRVENIVQVSGIVDIQRPLDVTIDFPETQSVEVINSLPQHNVTISGVSGIVQVSGIVDFQRPVHVIVDSAPPATFTPPIQQNVSVSGVVQISGVVDFQRPVTISGIGGEFIAGVSDFTKFPLFGSHFTQTMSYTAPDLIEYVGWAPPGTSKAAEGWAIMKLTYSGISILDTQWAAGNRLFNKVWNDRTTYLYS